ncbi:MAG: hypothetical protein IT539_00770 [Bradyrhizobiaceae bacterium]|nr:hypothetical protein [Bradyrhizobiaceae bacterium]
MSYVYRGAGAGLFAAAVLAAVLQLNAEYGFMPELDFAALLGSLFGAGRAVGWVLHFLIGATWGALFAWLDPDLPGDNLRQRGVVFAGVAWFVMMISLLPLAGFGPFGLGYGVLLPLAVLALHIVFGDVMGRTYGWLLLQGMPIRYRDLRPPKPAAAVRVETAVQEPAAALPSIDEPDATLVAAPAEVVPIEAARTNGRQPRSRKPVRRPKIGA